MALLVVSLLSVACLPFVLMALLAFVSFLFVAWQPGRWPESVDRFLAAVESVQASVQASVKSPLRNLSRRLSKHGLLSHPIDDFGGLSDLELDGPGSPSERSHGGAAAPRAARPRGLAAGRATFVDENLAADAARHWGHTEDYIAYFAATAQLGSAADLAAARGGGSGFGDGDDSSRGGGRGDGDDSSRGGGRGSGDSSGGGGGGGGRPAWQQLIEREEKGRLRYTMAARDPGGGGAGGAAAGGHALPRLLAAELGEDVEYLSTTIVADTSAQELMDFFLDDDYGRARARAPPAC